MKSEYFFGRVLTRQIDFFAFPRTGSHLFRYCTAGLFDLVALPQPGTDNQEAIDRQQELDPAALYALDLREDGVPYAPVHFRSRATGQHGLPAKAEFPVIILIRDPIPTLYSFYRATRDHWRQEITDPAAWLRAKAARYTEFYDLALALVAQHPADSLLLRYEDLTASPTALERVVALVGVRPKLSPAFVHWLTSFERFTKAGERTFYRAGNNEAWREDAEWKSLLERSDLPDLQRITRAPP